MRILTFAASLSDDAPERYRCAARILLSDGTLHPGICHASSKSEARAKMQAFWDAELKRAQERREAGERRVEAMRAAREARSSAP
ncbi:MAG: hypothetical protein JWQ97_978 [Phenylobacterium sp.]|nr:hypothetical protein [Phenylobacterium sp.]